MPVFYRRSITHQSQENVKMSASEKAKIAEAYLESYRELSKELGADFIFQMDETPCYFDLVRSKTIHFKGILLPIILIVHVVFAQVVNTFFYNGNSVVRIGVNIECSLIRFV